MLRYRQPFFAACELEKRGGVTGLIEIRIAPWTEQVRRNR